MKVYSKYDTLKSWSYPSHGHTFIPNFRLTLNLQNDLLLPMPFNSYNSILSGKYSCEMSYTNLDDKLRWEETSYRRIAWVT